jgi:aspartyl-tRNA(Asn)/glutamyl-tRNA(Gln) amidotransferase subunit B
VNTGYEPVIGLEVHAQLSTESKAFCSCPTKFTHAPNTNVCPVCLGLPGVLPVLNKRAVEFAVRMGLAVKSAISPRSLFARKNYFYPDLPKGYQISQFAEPLCTGGFVEVEDVERRKIRLLRIHLEEDAGKSIHDQSGGTLVDLNRCGIPLIEIVSEPDIRSPREASLYMSKIRQIVTYLGICDGNMEEGSLRCDANVSVRTAGEEAYGTKTEIKNLNSFRFVEHALEFEIRRQIELLERGERVIQETRLWDADRNVTVPMRSKEEAHDYRYFPEPDLFPVDLASAWISEIERDLAEHPTVRRDRFMAEYRLPRYDADILTSEKAYADYFEATVRTFRSRTPENAKAASNWVMTDVLRVVGEQKIAPGAFPVSPGRLASMIMLIHDGVISGKIAKELFTAMLTSPDEPRSIVEQRGWGQISDRALIVTIVDEVLARHPAQVGKYKAGERKVLGFFVGEIMKATQGKANPAVVNDVLGERLAK